MLQHGNDTFDGALQQTTQESFLPRIHSSSSVAGNLFGSQNKFVTSPTNFWQLYQERQQQLDRFVSQPSELANNSHILPNTIFNGGHQVFHQPQPTSERKHWAPPHKLAPIQVPDQQTDDQHDEPSVMSDYYTHIYGQTDHSIPYQPTVSDLGPSLQNTQIKPSRIPKPPPPQSNSTGPAVGPYSRRLERQKKWQHQTDVVEQIRKQMKPVLKPTTATKKQQKMVPFETLREEKPKEDETMRRIHSENERVLKVQRQAREQEEIYRREVKECRDSEHKLQEQLNKLQQKLNEAESLKTQYGHRLATLDSVLNQSISEVQDNELSILLCAQVCYDIYDVTADRSWVHMAEKMEEYLGLIPGKNLHKTLQIDLENSLRRREFNEALILVRGIFDAAPDHRKWHGGFQNMQLQLQKFEVIRLAFKNQSEEAFTLLTTKIHGFMQSIRRGIDMKTDENEKRAYQKAFYVMLKDYYHLASFIQFRFPQVDLESDILAIKSELETYGDVVNFNKNPYETWSWDASLANFWNDAETALLHPTQKHNKMAQFVARFFVDRRKLLLHVFGTKSLSRLLTDALKFRQIERILKNQEFNDTAIESALGFNQENEVERQYSVMSIASELTKPVESRNSEKSIRLESKISSNTNSLALSTQQEVPEEASPTYSASPGSNEIEIRFSLLGKCGPLTAQIECMDVADYNNDILIAVSYQDKKQICVWSLLQRQNLLLTHTTKKPSPSQVTFFKSSSHHRHPWLLYADYSDVYLLDFKRHQVICHWSLHRNIILHLHFLPFTLPSPSINFNKSTEEDGIVAALSLAFDHSIKVWNVAVEDAREAVLDKLHSSSGQPYTCFVIRKGSDDDSNGGNHGMEVIVAQEKGVFKIFKMRRQGSLHFVHQLSVPALKSFSKVCGMEVDPHNRNRLLLSCESDTRVIELDLETGEITRHFSDRHFMLSKKAQAGYSPCGNYVYAKSTSSVQGAQTSFRRASMVVTEKKPNDVGVFMWRASNGKAIRRIELGQEFNSNATHCQWLSAVANKVSGDKQHRSFLVAAGRDGMIRLFGQD